MRKLILYFGVFSMVFISCKTNKSISSAKETKTVVIKEQTEKEDATEAKDDLIAAGKVLFYEKTCAACHTENERMVGPSIKKITSVYTEKHGNLMNYLKGSAKAIVETDPGQVAIMKANIDAIVKEISSKDLHAITAYMLSVK